MSDILDFLARTHTPWSHARGRAGTALLLREISLPNDAQVLEIGFGTGQTLVEMAVRWPHARFFGMEKSPHMRRTAQRRWRFCGLKNKISVAGAEKGVLPYPADFFDLVYVESVLGILPDEEIPTFFAEIFRVLRPGGVFLNNESLWREGVPVTTRQTINARCRDLFGIPQAPEQFAHPEDWRALAERTGFMVEKQWNLHGLALSVRRSLHPRLLRAAFFSALGKIKGFFNPALRRQKRAMRAAQRSFEPYGPYLEGVLFKFSRPGHHGQGA